MQTEVGTPPSHPWHQDHKHGGGNPFEIIGGRLKQRTSRSVEGEPRNNPSLVERQKGKFERSANQGAKRSNEPHDDPDNMKYDGKASPVLGELQQDLHEARCGNV